MTDTKIDLKALKAAVDEGPPNPRPQSNSVMARLAALSPAKREAVESILFSTDPRWTAAAAARKLSDAGFKVSRTTVRDNRAARRESGQ